jgi:hypothetical protein
MSNALQVVAGIVLLFFLPGYTLVNLLFPRKGELDPEYDQVYRIALGMALSIAISIMVGFGLNAISDAQHAYVTSGPLWGVLLLITGLFTLGGWLRGAYPLAGMIHPKLYRSPSQGSERLSFGLGFDAHRRASKILLEREYLLAEIKTLAERSTTSNPQRSLYYKKRLEQARQRIEQINEELKSLEKEAHR